jgi:hypothetical protein
MAEFLFLKRLQLEASSSSGGLCSVRNASHLLSVIRQETLICLKHLHTSDPQRYQEFLGRLDDIIGICSLVRFVEQVDLHEQQATTTTIVTLLGGILSHPHVLQQHWQRACSALMFQVTANITVYHSLVALMEHAITTNAQARTRFVHCTTTLLLVDPSNTDLAVHVWHHALMRSILILLLQGSIDERLQGVEVHVGACGVGG